MGAVQGVVTLGLRHPQSVDGAVTLARRRPQPIGGLVAFALDLPELVTRLNERNYSRTLPFRQDYRCVLKLAAKSVCSLCPTAFQEGLP